MNTDSENRKFRVFRREGRNCSFIANSIDIAEYQYHGHRLWNINGTREEVRIYPAMVVAETKCGEPGFSALLGYIGMPGVPEHKKGKALMGLICFWEVF